MASSFSAQVDAWARKSEKTLERVFKTAAQKVADRVLLPVERGGNMPVDTGNLRRSLLASTAIMPGVQRGVVEFPDNGGQISLVIAGANITDTIYLGFQAAYARRVNYGFTGTDSLGRQYNQSGRGFVGAAAQQWQQIVNESVKEVRGT